MSLSVELRWDGMDRDRQFAASVHELGGTTEWERGWRVGYEGYLHDFNGPGTVAGTLVRDWFRYPARETPLDVDALCRNLPAALHRLYEDDDHEHSRAYRVALLTAFVVRAVELRAVGHDLRVFVW